MSIVPASGRSLDRKRPAATPEQVEEMAALVEELRLSDNHGAAANRIAARLVAKRSWFKRGLQAQQEFGDWRPDIPESEQPFYDFYMAINERLHRRIFNAADDPRKFRAEPPQMVLERMAPGEFGKGGAGEAGPSVMVVNVIRPPRELPADIVVEG